MPTKQYDIAFNADTSYSATVEASSFEEAKTKIRKLFVAGKLTPEQEEIDEYSWNPSEEEEE